MKVCGLFDADQELIASWVMDNKGNFIRAATQKGLKRPLNPKIHRGCHVREMERAEDNPEENTTALEELEAIDCFEEIVSEFSLVLVNPKEIENEILEEW